MARRIRARTLALLVARYIELFPEEAASEAARIDEAERAGLLSLLPPSAAWALLGRFAPKEAAEWLKTCDDASLSAFARAAEPGGQADMVWEADESLRARVAGILHPAAPSASRDGSPAVEG